MKTVDLLAFGINDIKKHKLRFCLNTLSVSIIFLIIFFLISLAVSISATADTDMEKHLIKNNNNIIVKLEGTQQNRKKYSVTANELDSVRKACSPFGSVETKENIRISDLNIKIGAFDYQLFVNLIDEKNLPVLVDGIGWCSETQDTNGIWLTQDIFDDLVVLNTSISIGSDIVVQVNGKSAVFKLNGIMDGINTVFVCKKYGLRSGIAYVTRAEFYIKLNKNSAADIRNLDKNLSGIEKSLDKDNEQNSRVANNEIMHMRDMNMQIEIYRWCIAAIIIYFAILILGVIKNNAVINIYDNLKTFSILKAIGLDNKKIVGISMIESAASIIIAAVLGGGIALVLNNAVEILANKLLSKKLLDVSVTGYLSGWWIMACLFAVILLLAAGYFALTLTKSLKRKNLLQTLKRE